MPLTEQISQFYLFFSFFIGDLISGQNLRSIYLTYAKAHMREEEKKIVVKKKKRRIERKDRHTGFYSQTLRLRY